MFLASKKVRSAMLKLARDLIYMWLGELGPAKNYVGKGVKDIPNLYRAKKYDIIERYVVEELFMCERLYKELTMRYPAFFDGRIYPLSIYS